MNLYGFVLNNSVQYVDRLGLTSEFQTMSVEREPCVHAFVLGHGHDVLNHINAWLSQKHTPVGISYMSGLGCNIDGRNGYYGIPGTPNLIGSNIGVNGSLDANLRGEVVTNGGLNAPNAGPRESALAFLTLVRQQWLRTLKHANDQANNCLACECKDGTKAIFVLIESGWRVIRGVKDTITRTNDISGPTRVWYDVNSLLDYGNELPNLLKGQIIKALPVDKTVIHFKCAH